MRNGKRAWQKPPSVWLEQPARLGKQSARLPGKQPPQGQVADKASQNHGCQIQKVSGGSTYGEGNLVENNLSVWIIGADIKHISVAVGVGNHVYERGYTHAGQKQGQHGYKVAWGPASQAGHGAVQADEDEHKMPQEPVERQKQIGMHEAAGFRQCHDASQKGKILHEGAYALFRGAMGRVPE